MMGFAPQPPPRYQFSLRRLFLVTTLVSLMASAWAGLMNREGSVHLGFYLMIVAGPLAVLMLMSLFRTLMRLWRR